jgi:hypothetical protein
MLQQFLALIFLCLLNNVRAMENELMHKSMTVYAHGFDESSTSNMAHDLHMGSHFNKPSVPEFPDAPGRIDRACFYTKPAVHVLAQDLKKCVVAEGYEEIHLVGRSCGGGQP